MFEEKDLLPGYAWAVHSAFANQMARRELQEGDLVYSNLPAWRRGVLEEGDRALQVDTVVGVRADARVTFALHQDAWGNSRRMTCSAADVIAFFETGDDAKLVPQ